MASTSTADDAIPVLASTPVARGELWRVLRSRPFQRELAKGVLGNIVVHVIVGWVMNLRVHKEACFFDHRGTVLSGEVWVDSLLTAFFVCGSQIERINDVRAGKLPLVAADAYPRGPLAVLFFRGSCVRAPSRKDHCTNLTALFSVALAWGVLWGALTYGLLYAAWALPVLTPARGPFCLSPWAFTAARAGWTAIEAGCVCAGSYLLWCTKGEGAPRKGALVEPLAAAEHGAAVPLPSC